MLGWKFDAAGISADLVHGTTTLGIQDEVACAGDINPYKHGTFLARTGHPIVGPDALRASPPDVVIVMNPIYCTEIQADLREMQLEPLMLEINCNRIA